MSPAGPAVTAGPCGAPTVAPYTHVIWVWMENHSYLTIIGSSQAPTSTPWPAGAVWPQQPQHLPPEPANYIAGTSGTGLADIKKFDSDCSPSQTPGWPTTCPPSSPARHTSGTTAVFLAWGEGGSNDRATDTTDIGCHVVTIVASPSTVPGTTSATPFNHSLPPSNYLGLPALGNASAFPTLTSAFNL
jgi:hypothetical protein